MTQLTLDQEAPRLYTCCGAVVDELHTDDCPNPNVGVWIDRAGRPLRRLWCSDSARLTGVCPYVGERERFRPAGGCCFDLREKT